ncbi:HesA/MoeB/ThiF family protein [Formicincola oecophyllae]|uniref:HesA/MoeB/ThiF family protein n=1 Tax=Formicincola oecophyllae TaxID=2558361 RepID=UPI00143D4D14|nr:HesA/MoeB/ThiF family protein [Formicincola oecophyllae]
MLLPNVGAAGQARLANAAVLVVGAGGLGAPLARALVGAGVGRVGVVDHDQVALSNLHRQPPFVESDVGRPKVAALLAHLRALNSAAWLDGHEHAADAAFMAAQVPRYDIVCDATDDATTRLLLSDACKRAGRSLVSGAAQGWSGWMVHFPAHPGGPCQRCLHPHMAGSPAASCTGAGVIGPVPGLVAQMMALEVVRLLLEPARQQALESTLHLWEGQDMRLRGLTLRASLSCPHYSMVQEGARQGAAEQGVPHHG